MLNQKINWNDFNLSVSQINNTNNKDDNNNIIIKGSLINELEKINFNSSNSIKEYLQKIYENFKNENIKDLDLSTNSLSEYVYSKLKMIKSAKISMDVKRFYGEIFIETASKDLSNFDFIDIMMALNVDVEKINEKLKNVQNNKKYSISHYNETDYFEKLTLFVERLNKKNIELSIKAFDDLKEKKYKSEYINIENLINSLKNNKMMENDVGKNFYEKFCLIISNKFNDNFSILKEVNFLQDVIEDVSFDNIRKIDRIFKEEREQIIIKFKDRLQNKQKEVNSLLKKYNMDSLINIEDLTIDVIKKIEDSFSKNKESKIKNLFKELKEKRTGFNEKLEINLLMKSLSDLKNLLEKEKEVDFIQEIQKKDLDILSKYIKHHKVAEEINNITHMTLNEQEKIIEIILKENPKLLIECLKRENSWSNSFLEDVFISKSHSELNRAVFKIFKEFDVKVSSRAKSEVIFEMLVDENKILKQTKLINELINLNEKYSLAKKESAKNNIEKKQIQIKNRFIESFSIQDVMKYIYLTPFFNNLNLILNTDKTILTEAHLNATLILLELENSDNKREIKEILSDLNNIALTTSEWVINNLDNVLKYYMENKKIDVSKYLIENLIHSVVFQDVKNIHKLISMFDKKEQLNILNNVLNSPDLETYLNIKLKNLNLEILFKYLLTESNLEDGNTLLLLTSKMDNSSSLNRVVFKALPNNIKLSFEEIIKKEISIYSFVKEYLMYKAVENSNNSNNEKIRKKI